MSLYKTFAIPAGYAATLVADAFVASGTYTRLNQPGGSTVYTPVSISASATVTIGPFNEYRNYVLEGTAGDVTYSLAFSGIYTAADEGINDQAAMDLKANLAGPTFTGTVVLPSTTSIGSVSSTEVGYLNNVTSAIQTQMDLKAPLASPTFTGTVVLPTPFTIGAVSMTATGTELNFVDGVTSAIQTQIDSKSPSISPSFTTPALGVVSSGDISACTSTSMVMVTPTLGAASATSVVITKANGTEAGNAVTASGNAGVITTSALTTAAGGTYAITWTNTAIASTSVVLLTQLGGTNTKYIQFKVVPGSGTATLTIENIDLIAALDGTVLLGYLVV